MINVHFTEQSRLDLINLAIQTTSAKTYLEIGCQRDVVFNALPVEYKIGVDPERGGNRRMTSDKFFIQNSDTFDVIFIDGLHEYNQVTRDLQNSLSVLNSGGIIILHDMLPLRYEETIVPMPSTAKRWLGDVWKLAFDLSNREDVSFNLIKIDCGCGVVTRAPQASKNIKTELTWEFYEKHWEELPLKSFDEFSHMLPTLTRL